MKKKYFAALTSLIMAFATCGCGEQGQSAGSAGTSGKNTETLTVQPLGLWYLASDDTDDYSGQVSLYDSSEYSSLATWLEDNQGKQLESVEASDDGLYTITCNASQKEELQQIVEKKMSQVLEELPGKCGLIDSASVSENDDSEFDIYFAPEAWLDTDMLSVSDLGSIQDLIVLGNFWQLEENLENGSDFAGSIKWKNANSGYTLLTFDTDPDTEDTFDGSMMAIRHTNYADYDGTLDFTASYIGPFTDDSSDGTYYEFEISDDRCYTRGEKISFRAEELPLELAEGDEVYVTFPGDNLPKDYVFTSRDQEVCFDEDNVFEMSLAE